MLDRIQTRLTTHAPEQRIGATTHPIGAAPSGVAQAVLRGFRMRCAGCGSGRMFRSFLQPVQACATCGIDWRRRTADDFPPYLVILLIGHIIAPLIIWMETAWHPPMWVHLALWLPAVALLALGLNPGMTVARPSPLPTATCLPHDLGCADHHLRADVDSVLWRHHRRRASA